MSQAVNNRECKGLQKQDVIHRQREFSPILHTNLHNVRANRKTLKGNQIIVLTVERDKRIFQE
jgi:hypothetical protein